MKEIIQVLESRVKSPLLGYFSLAFVATNWKELFFLLASDEKAPVRIAYFQHNTSWDSLVIYPAIVAAVFVVIYPWVNLAFLFATTKPTEIKNNIQANSESRLLMKKRELEEERAKLLSAAESELIDRAKRDEELNKIEDDDIKHKLKSEIEELRKERDNLSSRAFDHTDPDKLMKLAESYRDRAHKTHDANDAHKLRKRAQELEEKAHLIATGVA